MMIVKDAMQAMESVMTEQSIVRSDEVFERELLMLNLAELREQYNIKQNQIDGFSQPAVSRIERRTDIKLSTLVKYVTQLGLEMEIKVRPRNPKPGGPSEVMLFHT